MFDEGRGPEWEHHTDQCASFLVSVLTGEAETGCFPDLPAEIHWFGSDDGILARLHAHDARLRSRASWA
ncbi:hypothetical protein [Streptomyces shenzhenensis]|uniref:hypothetical protein n=1 Tax=Streptomyces shenzhenensis TaxID=943815 RepID=UPI00215DBD6C|nr:hypothetical protein [Streptomyces shenzhenensis]